jgi:hypothetical protein
MSHPSDTTADGNGDTFTPQQAAALLDEATWKARRELVPNPPWVLVTRGVLVLAACGAVWLSVRGQNPYKGPSNADIPILIAFVILNGALAIGFRRRAGAGIQGPSRLRPAEIALAGLAWVAAAGLMVGLGVAGLNYAFYPTTVLLIPGVTWALVMMLRKDWRGVYSGASVAVVGAVGLAAAPAAAWLVAGVGLCLALSGGAALTARRQRA